MLRFRSFLFVAIPCLLLGVFLLPDGNEAGEADAVEFAWLEDRATSLAELPQTSFERYQGQSLNGAQIWLELVATDRPILQFDTTQIDELYVWHEDGRLLGQHNAISLLTASSTRPHLDLDQLGVAPGEKLYARIFGQRSYSPALNF